MKKEKNKNKETKQQVLTEYRQKLLKMKPKEWLAMTKVIKIDDIRPNPWNPKRKGTPEYESLKDYMQKVGIIDPINVREIPKDQITENKPQRYEIIDGEQRWTVANEIGRPVLLAINFGKEVPDVVAKEKTLWSQFQAPMDSIMEARMVTEALKEYDMIGEMPLLPYDESDTQQMKEMADFNWTDYQKSIDEQDEEEKNKEDENVADEELTKKVVCPKCNHEFEIGRTYNKNA